MGSLVSKKRKNTKNKITDQDRAVLDLKNSRDRLKRYQKRLDAECDKLQAQALAMVKEGRKDRALLLLKVKKLKQDQATKADSQLLSVLQLMDTIDWESQQLKVFDALKEGNAALNKLHEEMPLDKVEDLLADTAESIAMEQEISKALGGSWTDANEEDLLDELASIEQEQAAESAAAGMEAQVAPPAPTVVDKPSTEPVTEPAAAAATAEPAATAVATAEAEAALPSLEEQLPEAPTTVPVVPVSVAEVEQALEAERATLLPV